MKLRLRHIPSLAFGMAMLFWLCACNPFGGNTTAKTGVTSNSTATPTALQALQNATNAMAQLKTVHLTMHAASSTKAVNANNIATSAAQSISSTIKAEGDQIFPDQASLHFTMSQVGVAKTASTSEIVTNKKLYLQGAQGPWYVTNMSTLTGTSAIVPQIANYNNLLVLAQRASIADHGSVLLNGQTVRYMTVTFDKSSLKDLLNATGQLGSLSAQQQQDLNTYLNKIDLQQSELDLWLSPTTSYVQRMELKIMMNIDTNSLATPTATTPAKVASDSDTVIDYSKFNTPVTITAPANAIPSNQAKTTAG
ncbi:MAG TPA: hypothetical protein VHZ51_26345 [Ktedonobacteraceae bacterium]|jgi:hypothetical protein|nr:hypothetical protein [Ktedonobacteraceae bacterium]